MSIGKSLWVYLKKSDGFGNFVEIKHVLIGAEEFGDCTKLAFKPLVPRHARHARDFWIEEEEKRERRKRRMTINHPTHLIWNGWT